MKREDIPLQVFQRLDEERHKRWKKEMEELGDDLREEVRDTKLELIALRRELEDLTKLSRRNIKKMLGEAVTKTLKEALRKI